MSNDRIGGKVWRPPGADVLVPCAVEVPETCRQKAKYALRMLLTPLGLEPAWLAPGDLPDNGVYYGIRTPPSRALTLDYDYDAPAFFSGGDPFDAAQVQWFEEDRERWPMLFSHEGRPDLVASTFFWLGAWQERTIRERDIHGRFLYEHSLHKILDIRLRPVVDMYRRRLARMLRAHNINVNERRWYGRPWAFCSTHDVDYLSKWRPGIYYREGVQYFLRNQRDIPFKSRVRRLGHSAKDALSTGDPFQSALTRIREEIHSRNGAATFFLKTGATAPHDVFYRLNHRFLRGEVAALRRQGFEIGLHPSYHAHTHPDYMRNELERLTSVFGEAPVSVRQHYLRYEAPLTARLQAGAGLGIDSTLGFADAAGFRNATCMPFQVYDLDADETLDLWEAPLVFMESALFNRQQYSPAEAKDETRRIIDICRRFGGVCVGLWHNTLWDEVDYPGWGRHFTETLDEASDAKLTSLRDAMTNWK